MVKNKKPLISVGWYVITQQRVRADCVQTLLRRSFPKPSRSSLDLGSFNGFVFASHCPPTSMNSLLKPEDKQQAKVPAALIHMVQLCEPVLASGYSIWRSLTHQCVVEGLFDAAWMCESLVCSGSISQSGVYTQISLNVSLLHCTSLLS